jgi:hypothetical protein
MCEMQVAKPICTVTVPDEAIDAGAAFTVSIRVDAAGLGDPGSARVVVLDARGVVVSRAGLSRLDETAFETGDIALRAPAEPGDHAWRVAVMALEGKRDAQEIAAAACRFTVQAHSARLNAWDVPTAIPVGEPFTFKIGLACSAGCNLGGQRLRLVDHNGREAGIVTLGREPWPGTAALYVAAATATAPTEVGRHVWQIATTEWDTALPHAAGTLELTVNAAPAPECAVTINVVDYDKRIPIGGATVVLHPYRAVTDAAGVAKIRVTKGRYDALVSAKRYAPFSVPIEADANVAATVELERDETWKSEDEQFG